MMIEQVEVKKMLKVSVIQLLHGPWASPVILVMKKDGLPISVSIIEP
jgi:hypothetical protein